MITWYIKNVEKGTENVFWATIENDKGVSYQSYLSRYQMNKINDMVDSENSFQSEYENSEDAFEDMIKKAVGKNN